MVASRLRRAPVDSERLIFVTANSNKVLRLQPTTPSGSQHTMSKGKGTKVLGNLQVPLPSDLPIRLILTVSARAAQYPSRRDPGHSSDIQHSP